MSKTRLVGQETKPQKEWLVLFLDRFGQRHVRTVRTDIDKTAREVSAARKHDLGPGAQLVTVIDQSATVAKGIHSMESTFPG